MAAYPSPTPVAPEPKPFYKQPIAIVLGVVLLCVCVGCGGFAALTALGATQAGSALEAISTQAVATIEAGGGDFSAIATEVAADPEVDSETISAFDIEVGQCLNEIIDSGGFIQRVDVIPCDQPHDREVFAVLDYPAGSLDAFPGTDALAEFSEEQCLALFDPYVGLTFAESVLQVRFLYPTDESWADGDREVACLLYEDGTKLTESQQGSQR